MEGIVLARMLLSDETRNLVGPKFPKRATTGPPCDRRQVFNGMLWGCEQGRLGVIVPGSLELGIKPVLPSKENENRSHRQVDFDGEANRRRNIVERLIG